MKSGSATKFFLVIVIIAWLSYVTFAGNFLGIRINGINDIRTGIDIRGGIHATLVASKTDNTEVKSSDMDTAVGIINKRLDSKGIVDRNVTQDKMTNRIIIDIPFKAGETNFNPQSAIDELGKTAHLVFREVDENKKKYDSETGETIYEPVGKIVLEGKHVKSASVQTNSQTGAIVVDLKLDDQGRKDFAKATSDNLNKIIAIYMDNVQISAPVVNAVIDDGAAIIEGKFTASEAAELASLIRSGNMPVVLKANEISSISPVLGDTALKIIINAGILAFILIFIFMLAFYRLPGLVSVVSLFGLGIAQLFFLSWSGLSLTLPGIAGIILSLGMGVDANIIIFERLKEELRNGKTLQAGIDVGFKRAFSAILDGNMTTVIAGVILILFGTGPIKGFGYTLTLGVLLSFVTAITATRLMLQFVANADFAKNKWLYGIRTILEPAKEGGK